uniref:DM5 domain-containing protein n=1 Tax=Haemonchus contortus TaxID=6289 RepID=A0A7I4YAT3_HAECO
MVGKQLQPPSSTSYVTTGSGYTTPEQVVIEGKRTVKVQKRGNEWESDSEYVSTTEATQTNVGGSTITNIPTTESQLPPSIQELLTPTTQGGTSSSVQQTISTSTVTSRQYRTEPNTTVTHTTITFSEPESNVTTGTTETTTKPQVGQQPQTTPRQAPKMVVPNINAPVQSPLLLRVSPVHDAVVAHVDSDRLSTPKERVELWQAETVELVKCQKYPIVKVDSKVLYRKVAEEKVVHWTAAKPYQIILTTVEKDDPQMVKRVRLEQNPLYERMPSQCNVAEVDMYTTEQVDYKTHSTTGEQSRTERHTYHDHQLIQRWKNTIHVENRRQRIDW